MPRRSARIAERMGHIATERYYDWLYEGCRCYELMEDDDPVGARCPYCECQAELEEEREQAREKMRAAAEEPPVYVSRWQNEIVAIRGYLNACEAARSVEEKIPIMRNLFTTLLAYREFLAAQPKFRLAVRNKIAQLRADLRAVALTNVMEDVSALIQSLEDQH
jgi:hypothetical protein